MSINPPARVPGVREVAAAAGVSRTTVSRVINEHPSIRESTRLRVHEAMTELLFRPNQAARALTTAKSKTIGVLTSSTSLLFGPASAIVGIEHAARERGYFVSVARMSSLSADDVKAAIDHLMAQSVDGIIVVAPQERTLAAIQKFNLMVPSMALHDVVKFVTRDGRHGRHEENFESQNDGARLATEHLLNLGHIHIGHLAGPEDWAEATVRRNAFLAAINNVRAHGYVSIAGDWTAESGFRIGQELLINDHITAVFSANDQMALGLLHALRLADKRVPNDVSVVGFDDIPESAYFAPPLTTVRQDYMTLGQNCVQRLLAIIEGVADSMQPKPKFALVVRSSTAPPPCSSYR